LDEIDALRAGRLQVEMTRPLFVVLEQSISWLPLFASNAIYSPVKFTKILKKKTIIIQKKIHKKIVIFYEMKITTKKIEFFAKMSRNYLFPWKPLILLGNNHSLHKCVACVACTNTFSHDTFTYNTCSSFDS
jgi:hypothetical protein